MIVLVTGGREYYNRQRVFQALSKLHRKYGPITLVVHGDARGADASAHAWANQNHVRVIPCPADWDRYKNAAGPIRNGEMLKKHRPDVVLAFPGGNGTQNMIDQARKAGVRILEVDRKPLGGGNAEDRVHQQELPGFHAGDHPAR